MTFRNFDRFNSDFYLKKFILSFKLKDKINFQFKKNIDINIIKSFFFLFKLIYYHIIIIKNQSEKLHV